MLPKPFTLASQIKKEIGNRIMLCSVALFLIISALVAYDISNEINQLPSRISPEVKSLEIFTVNEIIIDNTQTIQLKLTDFNESNTAFKVTWVPQAAPKSTKVRWHFPFLWVYDYPLGEVAGFQLGYFQISGSFFNDPILMNELGVRIGLLLLFALAIFALLIPLAKKIPDKLFITPINRFLDLISDNHTPTAQDFSPPIELRELEKKIQTLLCSAKEYERNQAAIQLGNLIAQVVHDIRSPLSALNSLIKMTNNIPEAQRITMRNVSQRINDIANNLLTQYRTPKPGDGNSLNHNTLAPELLSILLDRMVSEKRVQYQGKRLEFHLLIADPAYSAFAMVEASRLKSALSNLINNAIEAIHHDEIGIIQIQLELIESELVITINDNGSGMPLEIQEAVLKGGVSIGKKNGYGIGLSSSRRLIETWGGRFEIESTPNKGTYIRLFLPQISPANWFLSELLLFPSHTIVILDDDPFIHEIWERRFINEIPPSANIQYLHFFDANELSIAFSTLPQKTLFLIDYELHQYNGNGLDMIENLNIASRTILVTSHDDVLELRERCLKSGIKILPKIFAMHMPIRILSNNPDIVFIDDSTELTESWRFIGELAGKQVLTFNDIPSARKVIVSLPKETLIYIDANLSPSDRGEDFAKELYEMGFKELYLATGYEKKQFAHCYWLKEIITKDPPFV